MQRNLSSGRGRLERIDATVVRRSHAGAAPAPQNEPFGLVEHRERLPHRNTGVIMASPQHAWLTPQAHERLSAELADLLAPGVGEADDGSTPAQQERKGRIRQIQQLLASAVVGEVPPDDGIAEPGMVLTVRHDDSGEVETFLLGTREAGLDDLEVYSPASPLGTALGGARRGEQRSYQVPDGTTVQVTLLDAVPYGRHVEQSIAQ